jgi:hypothetical protein
MEESGARGQVRRSVSSGHRRAVVDASIMPGRSNPLREEPRQMIKYVHFIDYPLGQKRAYLDWVRSIADTLQKPDELRRLASYDNAFSASPQRIVEFSFDSLEDAARYFERPEMIRIFEGELPQHGTNIKIAVMRRLTDYSKDTAAGE